MAKIPVNKPQYPSYYKPEEVGRSPDEDLRDYTIDPVARLKIATLCTEFLDLVIEAQFNPKEVQVDANVPWAKHSDKHGQGHLEYTGRDPRTVSLELMFDGAESPTGIGRHLAALQILHEPVPELKMPPPLQLVWGKAAVASNANLPIFPVVLESMSVKRTMYSRDGICLRATVNLKFKEIPEAGLKAVFKKS